MRRIWLGAALTLSVQAILVPVSRAGPAVKREASIEAGHRLYMQRGCYQCHGMVGQGSVLSGPSLSPLRPDSDAFRRYVRNPAGSMPPYTARILTDDELQRIERFIRFIPSPRSYTAIPLLARTVAAGDRMPDNRGDGPVSPGRAIFETHCAVCHGPDGRGGVGPSLLAERSKRSLLETISFIKDPPVAMVRLYPGSLSDAQVMAVSRHIRGED